MSDDLDLSGTVTWAELVAETTQILRSSGVSDNPALEARWIAEEATGTDGAEFVESMKSPATVRAVRQLDGMVQRRVAGEPIQYVLGHWAFRTLDLLIDRRVLIPRPETEVVAGLALAELDRQRPDAGGTVIDLGTGSGAIGLAIAAERVTSRVLLTDASSDALQVARANLAGLGSAGRSVQIELGSWFEAVPERFMRECDVIVSNPPYVRAGADLPESVVNWEPSSALLSGEDGLDDLRNIVPEATRWLRPSGALVLEMAPTQTEEVASLARASGFDVSIHRDLAGLERAIVARLQ